MDINNSIGFYEIKKKGSASQRLLTNPIAAISPISTSSTVNPGAFTFTSCSDAFVITGLA